MEDKEKHSCVRKLLDWFEKECLRHWRQQGTRTPDAVLARIRQEEYRMKKFEEDELLGEIREIRKQPTQSHFSF